ncbi:MAG TPA: hypothetical protein VEC06_08575 [Paucimonas sp.]|nr:hypothetical protein [Paucimonas sp.]
MSVLILENGEVIGPFKTIEPLEDRLRCDGVDYPFTVIGEYTIDENDGLAPVEARPPIVPLIVPSRKAFKIMKRTEYSPGLSWYDHIIATIEAIPDPQQREDAMTDFMKSLYFERYSVQTLSIGALAGLSIAQLDWFFIEADKLP